MNNYITLIALFLGQGLIGTVISLLTLTSTLVGNQLSPIPFLSTVPITMTILGTACMAYYAASLMRKYGRKIGFLVGSFIGIFSSLSAMLSIYKSSFFLFSISAFMLGLATAFNQYYRFAAAEIFHDETAKKRSTAFIISAGIIGGFLGPLIVTKTKAMFAEYPFLGTFLFTLIIFIAAFFVQLFISIPTEKLTQKIHDKIKINQICSKSFLLGTFSCAIGFSLMILIMNSAPLSMHLAHFDIIDSSSVLQWHFVAMYSPSLFMPVIIHKIKTRKIIEIGMLFFMIGASANFILSGYQSYLWSLIFVGVGWSFMFTGGTFLINDIGDENIKHKVQGITSLIICILNLIASLSVGILIHLNHGWYLLNAISLLIIILFYLVFKSKYCST